MRTFTFICGLIVGAFGVLSAQNLFTLRALRRPAPDARDVPVSERATSPTRSAEVDEALDRIKASLERELKDPQGKNLDPLAVLLEEAIFERSWLKVQAATEVVRARGAEWVAPAVSPPSLADEKSTFQLGIELRKRRDEDDLAIRRNRATALASSNDPRKAERWFDLLKTSPDGVERSDAAWLLARTADERTIAELVRLLQDPDRATRIHVGEGLAHEGYLAGLRELVRLARAAPEPDVRADAIDSLALYASVEGGESAPANQAILEALRGDNERPVRAEAARALQKTDLGRVAAFTAGLLEQAAHDDAVEVRGEALTTLLTWSRLHGGPPQGVLRGFERALQTEQDAGCIATIVSFLGTFGDQATLTAMEGYAPPPQAGASRIESGRTVADFFADVRERLRTRLITAR